MVRHQAVRVQPALVFAGQLPQEGQVRKIITDTAKAGDSVIAALDDVCRDVRDDQSSLPGHSG
jgi:hypothetical protein